MSRNLNSTAVAALSADSVQIYFAVELDFPDGALRLWSGLGEITIGGETYTGGGSMLGLSKIDESLELSARGASISLSGIPRSETDPMRLALTQDYQGRKGKIYLCILNSDSAIDLTASGYDASGVFDVMFIGFMDMLNINEGEASSTLSVNLESRLAALRKASNIRFTPAYQKSRTGVDSNGDAINFAEDEGFSFNNQSALQKITWGR